jgi:hypothetical protein
MKKIYNLYLSCFYYYYYGCVLYRFKDIFLYFVAITSSSESKNSNLRKGINDKPLENSLFITVLFLYIFKLQ